jgi:23S rRNA pseudouridine1911/1915/1917 synthase
MNNTKRNETEHLQPEIQILYEDNHIIAVNKRASEIVQGDKTGDEPMSEAIKRYLKKKYDKPGDVYLGTVHRLDRPVSGIVLFAKTSKSLSRLNEMFRGKEIQKTYWAVVKNKPEKKSALLIHYLRKNEAQNKSYASEKEQKGSLRCELEYRILSSSDHYHLLEVKPHTGRHHQIRVQLSVIGSPIKGDLKYGFNRSNENASIHLHARQIDFIHPVKKEPIRIVADPPNDPLWNHFMALLPFEEAGGGGTRQEKQI